VDAQRAYSAEPPPWYGDESRAPGQRDPRYGERYPDDPKYGDDARYGEERYREGYSGGYTGEQQRFANGEHGTDPRFDASDDDAERSARSGRRRARGARSGVPLPDEPSSPIATGSPVAPMVPPQVPSMSTVYQAGTSQTQPLPASQVSGPRDAYRARRPGVAALFGIVAVIVELLVLIKVVLGSMTAHPTNVGGLLAGLFAMCGVPLIAVGLYGLATGAAIAGGPNIARAWLRTPLAYLPVGLVLVLAAGLSG